MEHFAGLDVSVKETSICIVDDTGRIVREAKVASEPGALLQVLKNNAYHFKRIGLEAGPLSQWLYSALAESGLPVICVETRHMRAVLQAQINKTDRNDARGIAQMMRAGLYRPVHVKTLRSQKLRMLLTHRKLLQSKAIAVENDLRGTLRNFGLKVGIVGKLKFEARIKELVENLPDLAILVEPLLAVRRVLREQTAVLHRRVLAIVRDDAVCRRLMTTPGVGPVVALTFRATVDVPARFRNSKAVGAVLGLTPSRYQSGEINRTGAISKCGDEMMRVMLYEAAQSMLVRSAKCVSDIDTVVVDSLKTLDPNRPKRADIDLFDHLVGAGEYGRRHCEAERFRGLEVDHELVLGRRLHRQVGHLLALENTVDVFGRTPILVDRIGSIRDQAAATDEVAIGVNGGQSVLRCKGNDHIAMKCSSTHCHHQPAIGGAREGRDLALHFREVERIDRAQFHTERRRYGLDHRKLTDPGASRGIPNDCRSRHVRRDLLEQFHPFCGEAVLKLGKACNVAAGPGQTFDEARANWVDDLHKHHRDGAGRLHHRRHDDAAGNQDDVGPKRDYFRREFADTLGIVCGPAIVNQQIAAIGPIQRLERLQERGAAGQ